jgi:hypothetical protein
MNISISSDWDLWAIWLPMAKSIALKGDLISNAYFVHDNYISFATIPPLAPLIYSWDILISGDYPSLIAVWFYVLLGIAVYLLTDTIYANYQISLGAVILALSSPVIFSFMCGYPLNPDLPTALFISTSSLYLCRLLKGKATQYNLFGLGQSLMLLASTRVVGLIMVFVFLTITTLTLYHNNKKISKITFTLIFAFPFFMLAIISERWSSIPALLVFSTITYYIIEKLRYFPRFSTRHLLSIIICLAPIILYLFVIGFRSCIWAYSYLPPSYRQTYQLLQQITSNVNINVISFLSYFRLDDIFLRYLWISYTPLLFVGLFVSYNKSNPSTIMPYLMLVTFAMISSLYPGEYFPSQALDYSYVRRYMYFLPFIAILSSKGYNWLYETWMSDNKNIASTKLVGLILYISLSFLIISQKAAMLISWLNPFSDLQHIVELRVPLGCGYASVSDLVLIGSTLFLALEILSCIHKWATRQHIIHEISPFILIVITVLSSFSVAYCFRNPLLDVYYHDGSRRMSLPPNMEQLVTFFSKTNDSSSVIGPQIYFLITYANRSVIDLSLLQGYEFFLRVFENKSFIEAFDMLVSDNVKYIVEPSYGNPATLFQKYRTLFPSFDAILRSNYVKIISIADYKVYKLLEYSEYLDYINELRNLYEYQYDPITLLDDDCSSLFLTYDNVILSDTTAQVISGRNALKIEILNIRDNAVILYEFKSSMNFEGKDFISFYWYGSETGNRISIRFRTVDFKNQYGFDFYDSWRGWAKIMIPLSAFKVVVGKPAWNNITALAFEIPSGSHPTIYYLDKVTLDSGVKELYFIQLSQLKMHNCTSTCSLNPL